MESTGMYLLKSAVWLTGFTLVIPAGFTQRAVFPAQPGLPPLGDCCVDCFPVLHLAL